MLQRFDAPVAAHVVGQTGGAGLGGAVTLSEEAAAYFKRHRCQVRLLPTPEVIPVWNQAEGAVIGLVRVTC